MTKKMPVIKEQAIRALRKKESRPSGVFLGDDTGILLSLRLIRCEMEELSAQVKKIATGLDGLRLIALGYVKSLKIES